MMDQKGDQVRAGDKANKPRAVQNWHGLLVAIRQKVDQVGHRSGGLGGSDQRIGQSAGGQGRI
jgi:hypothetical protein